MYNTTKLNQSPSKNNSTLLSDTVNGFCSPKLTSTPLHRNGNYCLTPPPKPKPHLLSPKRYVDSTSMVNKLIYLNGFL